MYIEISPEEYWKHITREEAELYCQLLNIDGKNDWRLPTWQERNIMQVKLNIGKFFWTTNDSDFTYYVADVCGITELVVPVRTI